MLFGFSVKPGEMEGLVKEEAMPSLLGALLKIAVVSCCLWGAFFTAWWWHHRQQEIRKNDTRFTVKRVAARPVTQDRLPIGVLTELLHLDTESNISLFALQPQETRERLLSCPAVESAKVWRLLPGTLGIEYALRTPVATIAGFKNVGIDASAIAFFLFPYYAPKRLPAIVVPIGDLSTLTDVQRRIRRIKETAIALRLIEIITPIAHRHHLAVDLVDLSHFHQQSVFRREVIIAFTPLLSKDERLYVRVHSKKLTSKLEKLPTILNAFLRGSFREGTIDLRYDGCAILSGEIAQKT
jgi:hypothetical protein